MKIAAYVVGKNAKQTYASDSYDARGFVGLEVVCDSLRRCGYCVEYCSSATAHAFDIVLVSITSSCDWWPFIREQLTWRSRSQIVIVGGPGVLNVRPFLPYFDFAVLGRGENVICDLVKGKSDSDGVVESKRFSISRPYRVLQSRPYSHGINVGGAKYTSESLWRETNIGCRRKCFFCNYTWTRQNITDDDASYSAGYSQEFTVLDWVARQTLPHKCPRLIGLDGSSERIRRMVNKPISSCNLCRLLIEMSITYTPQQVRLYNIIGYPGENASDWDEHEKDLAAVDLSMNRLSQKQWSIVLHCTPFRAMPYTPCACWPMSKTCFRTNSISKHLKRKGMPGNVYFQGKNLWAVEGMGTDSLASVALDVIALRGDESVCDKVAVLASHNKFWSASSPQKVDLISRLFPLDRLFGEFTPDTLPTRNIHTYRNIRFAKWSNA